jgi:hypothetical protein
MFGMFNEFKRFHPIQQLRFELIEQFEPIEQNKHKIKHNQFPPLGD